MASTAPPATGPEATDRPRVGRLRRMLGAVLAVVCCASPLAVAVADRGRPAAAADPPAAVASAEWLAGKLDDGRFANPLAPNPDYGLMVDAVFAMYAAGRGDLAEPILTVLDDEAYAQDFVSLSSFLPRPDPNRIGGAVAKTTVAALVAGRDVHDFAGLDLIEELRGAITPDGPQKGRLRDHGPALTYNNANNFGQALAVIAFAGLREVNRDALDFLLLQQCTDGFFRIFPTFRAGVPLSCDEGYSNGTASAPDGDATGLALSALLAAERSGATGLDAAIERTRSWLIANQDAGGGWGGGVSTEAPNTNSTGLIVQALADAGGASDAVSRGQAYLKASQAGPADAANALAGELGGMAYTPEQYESSRTSGIEGVDTWIRATAQASLGLSQAGFYDLVTGNVDQDGGSTGTTSTTSTSAVKPSTTSHPATTAPATSEASRGPATTRPATGPTGGGRRTSPVPSPSAGAPGPDPTSTADARPVVADESVPVESADDSPAGRLGAALAARLVDGDHIEAEVDGETFVDYDATADLVLALRALGEQPDAVERATAFLLDDGSIDAYVHGAPYDEPDAVYVESLAKLLVVIGLQEQTEGGFEPDETVTDDLIALLVDRRDGGELTDDGEFADETRSVARHAWAILALVAHGHPVGEEIEALIAVRCQDGTFPLSLAEDDCATGDVQATARALQALSARTAPGRTAGSSAQAAVGSDPETPDPEGSAERDAAIADAVAVLKALGSSGVVPVGGSEDVAATAASIGALAFVGEHVEPQGQDGIDRLLADLEVAAAPIIAGRDWTSTEESPIVAEPVEAPNRAASDTEAEAASISPIPATDLTSDDDGRGSVVPIAIALVLVVLAGLGVAAIVHRRRAATAATTA